MLVRSAGYYAGLTHPRNLLGRLCPWGLSEFDSPRHQGRPQHSCRTAQLRCGDDVWDPSANKKCSAMHHWPDHKVCHARNNSELI